MFLIYFVIILCFLINENDDSRCPVHSGYPKLEGGRISINFFVKNFDSVRAIAEAKYIGLRNQGRTKRFSNFSDIWQNRKILRKNRQESALFNEDLLVAQGVHPNPGPPQKGKCENLNIITYNCRGLRNTTKLRRILLKLDKLVNGGAIIALQETHEINLKFLVDNWKHQFVLNGRSKDQRGVATLFSKKYEIVEQYKDEDDRIIILNLKSELIHLNVANIYCPNDPKDNLNTVETMYEKLLEYNFRFPESHVIIAGDMNVCMSDVDSVNRCQTNRERIVVSNIMANNNLLKVTDSYRHLNPTKGYTWNRGPCFSRLDYIFVSRSILRYLKATNIDWAFDSSDHASVEVVFEIPKIKELGPGISRTNTIILENPKLVKQIKEELQEYLSQVPAHWNPNIKLEFLKVGIRTIMSEVAKQNKVDNQLRSEMLNGELNHLMNIKIKLASNQDMDGEVRKNRMEKLKIAIREIQRNQIAEESRHSDHLAKISKVKWFELGEKSNGYFLGLLNMRKNQKYIQDIICEGVKYEGIDNIMKGIRNFYENLYDKIVSRGNHEEEENFYKNCPKLSVKQKEEVDKPLTLDEISRALKSCKESSPGPDGITYGVYKNIWEIAGPIILESWNYSLLVGKLPPSHLESVITLLPKEGKDMCDIKNWRPITLANCDSKIITKALAIRISKVLETIIDKSQTAYVPGRSVMDNIRSNFLIKSHCRNNKINALLISLDARKAFDSVSHEYISETLGAYGFGQLFITSFKTLYTDLTSTILVNGFKTDKISINRGVKQGDALSCALFILCIDPLIRNIKANPRINGVEMTSKLTRKSIEYKVNGYADDIAITIMNNPTSVNQLFKEYERLTIKSGLELNADKTEILNLSPTEINGKSKKVTIAFEYMNIKYKVETVFKLKICGLIYADDPSVEKEMNIAEKINKLEGQLKRWMVRNLTLEGKILIVKTYGLSQLIYNMQCYDFGKDDLIRAERLIFKFIWSKKWENVKHVERIKRTILKNEYSLGGMKAPDIESLNRSLKLKQFIRSSRSDHPIRHLQVVALEKLNLQKVVNQEYSKLSKDDSIIRVGQETINILTDYCRSNLYGGLEKAMSSRHAIDSSRSINVKEFLERKNQILLSCFFNPLRNESIENLGDLLLEQEITQNRNHRNIIERIIKVFDEDIVRIATLYDENVNRDNFEEIFFLDGSNELKEIGLLSVRETQQLLKIALHKVETLNVEGKNNLNNSKFSLDNIVTFRKQCKNTKLRSIFYRLLNRDFFYAAKMHKYKMLESPMCTRCGQFESNEHLLFECKSSREMWEQYNKVMVDLSKGFKEKIESFEDIFNFEGDAFGNIVKIKLIQETIQIIRPAYWFRGKVENIAKEQKDLNHIKF